MFVGEVLGTHGIVELVATSPEPAEAGEHPTELGRDGLLDGKVATFGRDPEVLLG